MRTMKTPEITKEQAISAYEGNASALARALGITPSAVYQWPDGVIDERWALKLAFVLKPAVFGPDSPEARRTPSDADAPAEADPAVSVSEAA